MLYYAKSTGGFYDSALHGDSRPLDAVEITAAEHRALLEAQAQGAYIAADDLGRPFAALPPPPTIGEIAGAKVLSINAAFEVAAGQLTAGYPASEKLTWPLQEREALEWRAASTAATPYVDALALARGLDRVDYLNRTLAKVDAFRAASAQLIGTRQKYEDQVRAAEALGDAAAIDAVTPIF